MGSSTSHRPKGMSNKDYFQEYIFGDNYEVLDAAQQRGKPVYLAVRHPEGYVFGCVVLVHYNRSDYFNFWHKEIDESSGPCEDECPERILKLLSPLDEIYGPPFIGPMKQYQSAPGQHAREWRARCWANVERRKAQPKVTPGTVVRFAHPVYFGSYGEYDTFVFVKGSTFEVQGEVNGMGYPLRVRIRSWRSRHWEVVPTPDPVEQLETSYVV